MPDPRPPDHVLLIGIDAYDGGGALNGCVNDIDSIQRLLIDRLGVQPDRITRLAAPGFETEHPTDVPEEMPTLENIRNALRRLGGDDVAPGDGVFIYYSGHGTQVLVKDPATGTQYVREALVPQDRVVFTKYQFLFDWELNGLLARIAARTSSLTAIMDCCCSAGTTREAFDDLSSRARFLPSPEPFVLPEDMARPPGGSARGLTMGIVGSVQSCQVVAACQDDERARESAGSGGVAHGELTRALVNQLAGVPDDALAGLRWGRIWRAVLADVATINPAQHPWLSGSFARRVFSGPPEDGDVGYGVTRAGSVFTLDVGSLSGVTEGAEVAVYGSEPPHFPAIGSPNDNPVGRLRVTGATRSSATAVRVAAPFNLPLGARGRLVRAGQDARITVGLKPHDAAIAAMLGRSSLLTVVGASERGDVVLERQANGAWAVTDDVFGSEDRPGEPTLVIVPSDHLALIREVVEHYYWFSRPLRLAKACQDFPRVLEITVHDASGAESAAPADAQNLDKWPELPPGVHATYEVPVGDGERDAVPVCIGVENSSDTDLLVHLVACNQSGTVWVLSQKVVPPHAKHVFWDGDTIGSPFWLQRVTGQDLVVDRLVAIGTTNRAVSLAHLEVGTSFAKVLRRLRGEEAPDESGGVRGGPPPPELWTSAVTAWRLTRR